MPATLLDPIDVAPYERGNAGAPYVWSFEGPEPGPHVLIAGIVHGNEACGAHALAAMLDAGLRPRRGRLTLAFGNVDAYRAATADRDSPVRYLDEDLNRVWARSLLDDARKSSLELERARQLRPFVESADYLLDLHSMQQAEPPMLLCGTTEKTIAFARRLDLGFPLIVDRGHAAGVRLRDFGAFSDEASARVALLVECGQHHHRGSAAVALWTAHRFLTRIGTIRPEDWPDAAGRPGYLGSDGRIIDVTEAVVPKTERFRFIWPVRDGQVVAACGTVIAIDGDEPVSTPYDECLLVMPSQHFRRGHTAVRFGRVRTPGGSA